MLLAALALGAASPLWRQKPGLR